MCFYSKSFWFLSKREHLNCFRLSFSEWKKKEKEADANIRNAESFKPKLLKFIHPISNTICNTHNPKDIQLLTSLRRRLSHPRDYKFKQSISYRTNPLCNRDSPFYQHNSY